MTIVVIIIVSMFIIWNRYKCHRAVTRILLCTYKILASHIGDIYTLCTITTINIIVILITVITFSEV